MKPFWVVCAGIVGFGVPISFVALAPSAEVTANGVVKGSRNERTKIFRGRSHTAWRVGTEDLPFEKIPPGAQRERALRQLASRWTTKDPVAAVRWAESLKLESEREMALNQIAVAWGKKNPALAIELAQRFQLSQGIVDTISGRWGQIDLDAAMAWALDLPSKPAQENALLQIVSAHAEINPPAAALMVGQHLLPGPEQREAAMTVLYHWLRFDEVAAVNWSETFAEKELRSRAEAEIRGFRLYRASKTNGLQEPDRSVIQPPK